MNETRSSKKSENKITIVKNSFGEAVANNFKIASFFNYKFSRVGCLFEEENNEKVIDSTIKNTRTKKKLKKNCFRFVSEIKCKKEKIKFKRK